MNVSSSPIGRAVVTHGRSLHALVAAQSLGRKGVEVIGCDSTPFMTLSFSKYVKDTFLYPDPASEPDSFLQSLQEKIQEFTPDNDIPYVFMPIHRFSRLIAEHADCFKKHIRLTTPEYESIRQVFPKQNLVITAEKYGVAIPVTEIITDDGSVTEKAETIGYPVFLKVPDGSGGRGLIKADNDNELQSGYEKIKQQFGPASEENPMLLQEGVEGDDYCCSGLFQHGEYLAGMVHYNIQRFPYEGGFGVVRETVSGEPLIDAAKKLMKPLQWNGVVQLDFRWNGDTNSEPRLIEVNPRFWGSLFHTVESGVDYPWLLYQMTVEGMIDETPKPIIGVRTKIPILSTLSAIEESVQDSQSFGEIGNAWNELWTQMKTGNVSHAWSEFLTTVHESLSSQNPYQTFRTLMQDSKTAKPEFFSSEDPMVSLGVLYVLGSLIQHGRLPDELKR